MAQVCEVISKGYRAALAQIQTRIRPVWSRVFRCPIVSGRPHFAVWDFDYCEMEIPIAPHPPALTIRADPLEVIRPEGRWYELGALDLSVSRKAAAA